MAPGYFGSEIFLYKKESGHSGTPFMILRADRFRLNQSFGLLMFEMFFMITQPLFKRLQLGVQLSG